MKIVFLDRKSIGEDISLDKFSQFGDVDIYDFSSNDEARERTKNADVVVTCKISINAKTIGLASKLKMVCITGTGINSLDIEYLESKNIKWRNVRSYCTESVAQHSFAMLLCLLENIRFYDDYVRDKTYVDDTQLKHFTNKFNEISGKTWGIVGLGEIGREVAKIATAFGAKVIFYSASNRTISEAYDKVNFEDLLEQSDIISIHAPESKKTIGLFNIEAFIKMKKRPIIINVGRGSIINEIDLVEALNKNYISAAGLDVISKEPMSANSELLKFIPNNRLLITPHVAWASVESRRRVIDRIFEYIYSEFNDNMED